MNHSDMVFDNLRAMLRVFGGFSGSRYSEETPGLMLYDGGVDEPLENYCLLVPPGIESIPAPDNFENTAARALEFFEVSGRPCHWPIFPGVPDDVCRTLEGLGFIRDNDFAAMTAELSTENAAVPGHSPITGPLRDEKSAREWANIAWFGFDSTDPPPERFGELASSMAFDSRISLIHLAGRATGLLCAADGTAGVYYISTVPAFRRKGLGGVIVDALKAMAAKTGFERVTLLATPQGHPLYLKHGFRDTGAVKIYRTPDKNP